MWRKVVMKGRWWQRGRASSGVVVEGDASLWRWGGAQVVVETVVAKGVAGSLWRPLGQSWRRLGAMWVALALSRDTTGTA